MADLYVGSAGGLRSHEVVNLISFSFIRKRVNFCVQKGLSVIREKLGDFSHGEPGPFPSKLCERNGVRDAYPRSKQSAAVSIANGEFGVFARMSRRV